MPSLVVIGPQINEKQRGAQSAPVYMVPTDPSLSRVNICKTFKDVFNTLQNFKFTRTTVFEIAVGSFRPLVKGVGTKRLSKGRVKEEVHFLLLVFNRI